VNYPSGTAAVDKPGIAAFAGIGGISRNYKGKTPIELPTAAVIKIAEGA